MKFGHAAAVLGVLLAIFLFHHTSSATPIVGVGANVVYESSADGRQYVARQPISLRGGYRFSLADIYLEYTNFRVADSGTSMLYVAREHQEFLLWGRRIIRADWVVSPTAALGLGFEYDRVKTSFGAQSSEESGSPLAIMASALGARVQIVEYLDLQIEGRLSFGSGSQPEPLFGFGIAFGASF